MLKRSQGRAKSVDVSPEIDPADTEQHKAWLHTLGKANLPGTLLRDQGDAEKAFKKALLVYTAKELSTLSPLAPPPVSQDVVIYTRKGLVVGYSVGATSSNPGR